ncbi:MAG: hypothetical protein QOD82_2726, partial [Pseudonocardiales bacterium]|nr:hypothetical protein [Pseudonocardiales bacterium]
LAAPDPVVVAKDPVAVAGALGLG